MYSPQSNVLALLIAKYDRLNSFARLWPLTDMKTSVEVCVYCVYIVDDSIEIVFPLAYF